MSAGPLRRRRQAETAIVRALAAGDADGTGIANLTGVPPRRMQRILKRLERAGAISSYLVTSIHPHQRRYHLKDRR